MLILDAVTKSLKVVLAGAVATTQLPITAHYTDITTTTYTPGSNDTVTNNTTVVEFVAAPAASNQRHVESISVYNVDTATATVTIQYVSAGGTRQIIKVVLLTLEALFYEDGAGWQVIDASGNIKTIAGLTTALGTLPTQNPPLDADLFIYRASAAAWALVTATGTQIKAYLKTYFDSVYDAINAASSAVSSHAALLTGIHGLAITAGKTITCTQDTSLDEAVAMSSKAPKVGAVLTTSSVNGLEVTTYKSDFWSGDVTKTFTITFPAASRGCWDVSTIGIPYAGGAYTALAKWLIGGFLSVSTGYAFAELVLVNQTIITISTLTRGNGYVTFTVRNNNPGVDALVMLTISGFSDVAGPCVVTVA